MDLILVHELGLKLRDAAIRQHNSDRRLSFLEGFLAVSHEDGSLGKATQDVIIAQIALPRFHG